MAELHAVKTDGRDAGIRTIDRLPETGSTSDDGQDATAGGPELAVVEGRAGMTDGDSVEPLCVFDASDDPDRFRRFRISAGCHHHAHRLLREDCAGRLRQLPV